MKMQGRRPSLPTVLLTAIFLGILTPVIRAEDGPVAEIVSLGVPHRPATVDYLCGDQFAVGRSCEGIDKSETHARRVWTVSLSPLIASEALDSASSYGMRELNPLLAGPDGRFGMKAVDLKFGVIGLLVGVEYVVVKKYPRSAKLFSILNWTTAGANAGIAVHNYRSR